MKKAGKAFVGSMLCIMLVLSAVGCKKQETVEAVNVALLIGNHANAAAPNLTAAKQYIKEACKSFGFVSIIAVDGAPYQSAQADIPVPDKTLSRSKLKSISASQEAEIMGLAEESIAKSPEVDTLKAIELGVRSLHAQADGINKMLVLDSGICTAGSLDFTDSLLESVNTEKVAESLKEQGALPDMKGIEVIWVGLGDTEAPQKPLSSKNIEVLRNVWKKVLSDAGAEVTFSSELPTGNKEHTELPEVTAVEVLQPVSAISKAGYNPKDALILDQEVLNFKPESDELLTELDTLQFMLKPIADYMRAAQGYQILLCGTTATAGEQNTSIELSKKRCNAVKRILVSMGVQEGQILTLGMGYKDHPFHVDDINSDGSLNEELAKRNRAVIILPGESEIARTLLYDVIGNGS